MLTTPCCRITTTNLTSNVLVATDGHEIGTGQFGTETRE